MKNFHLKWAISIVSLGLLVAGNVALAAETRVSARTVREISATTKKGLKQAAKADKLTRLYLALIKKNERDVISLLQRVES